MTRFFYVLATNVLLLGLLGCMNVDVDKPLVDLGESSSSGYRPQKVNDPAPGVPDYQLTREQKLQRDLYQCQQLLEESERRNLKLSEKQREGKMDSEQKEHKQEQAEERYERLQDQYEQMEERYQNRIEQLQENIDDLEDENRDLREKLRD